MYDNDTLPLTGATIAIGGGVYSTWWIAVIGVGLVLLGTVAMRAARLVNR